MIILDLMLPGMSGEDVLKEIRAGKNVPVIIVSAKDELDTRVDLLVMGADDYLTKPFELKELEARVMFCLRRGKQENEENEDIMVYEEITLDKNIHEVRINDNPISLTRQEFKILELLISSHILEELTKLVTDFGIIKDGEIVEEISREELLEKCLERIVIKTNNPDKATTVIENMGISNYKVIDLETIHVYEGLDESSKINKELIKNDVEVFERFYKADKSRSQTSTGLGLAIAKEMTEKLDGRIKAIVVEGLFEMHIEFMVE